jgi:hypothetical protein
LVTAPGLTIGVLGTIPIREPLHKDLICKRRHMASAFFREESIKEYDAEEVEDLGRGYLLPCCLHVELRDQS